MSRTQNIDTLLKRDFTRAQSWLKEMLDKIGWGFFPDTDFSDYTGPDGQPLFTPDKIDENNRKMSECYELFSYFMTEPGDDIYSFCHNHLTSIEHAIHSFI